MNLIRHVGLYVNNLEMMKEFYCTNFEMTEAVHDTEVGDYISHLYGITDQEISVELYKLKTIDGSMVELLKPSFKYEIDAHSSQVYNYGCAHLAFTVKNVELMFSKLSSEGIKFYSKPLLSRDGMHKVCFCRDPEGNYLEIVEDLA